MKRRVNILSIDVEAWHSDLGFKEWSSYEDNVVLNVARILKLLKQRKIQASFFVLGYYAKCYPELIEKIVEENHEICSHGYYHRAITQLTHQQFEEDLLKSISALEKITGEKVLGYRAPFFSLVETTSWVIDFLKKAKLKYDSSIFPVRTHKYGVPGAPLYPYYISSENIRKQHPNGDFLEFPLSVYHIPGIKMNIPVAGGFYLRLFPYRFIAHAIKKINKRNHPAICYAHPWEFNLKHPRIPSIGWYNYYRLVETEKKFKKLIRDFKFTSMRNWIENER